MAVIRTDASRNEGGERTPQATADDSWRTWTHETPEDFFYLRQNREFQGSGGNTLPSSGGGAAASGGPKENPLHKFATYSWMWSLSVLSKSQTNFPDPLIGKFKNGITVAEDMGKSDYHFDNVNVRSLISATTGIRGAHSLTFAFDIVEPYSMGNFLKDLDKASKAQGFKNYADAGMMLAVKFDGYDDSGNASTVGPYNFTVKLVQAKFTVTEAGTVYKCLAVAWNDQAWNDEVATIKQNATLSGRTVEEMLFSGANSLSAAMNNIENKSTEAGAQAEGDQFYIVFPDTKTSAEESSILGVPSAGLTDLPVDYQQLFESLKGTGSLGDDGQNSLDNFENDINTYQLGTSKSSHDLGAEIYSSYKGNMNVIGKSEIIKQPEDREAHVNTSEDNAAADEDRMRNNPQNSLLPGDSRSVQIYAGQKLINVIEEVILASKYGREYGMWKPGSESPGKCPWFKLQCFVLATDGPKEAQSGRTGKIYIYRVIPYQASMNRFAAPGSKGIGGTNPHRIYNYIYTGKNNDILDLDLDFNYSFYVPIGNDIGQLERSSTEGLPAGQTDSDPNMVPKVANRPDTFGDEDSLTQLSKPVTNPSKTTGAQLVQHPETQSNRNWHEILMNSKVDLLSIKMKIHGDPYYLTSSGCGNYIAEGAGNVTKDDQIEYIQSEADIQINFETPFDMGTPWYKMEQYKFTGMYQVLTIDNSFTREGFTQVLNCIRHRNQGAGTASAPIEEGDIGNSVTLVEPGTNFKGTV
jgi:hypothetical protein